MAKSRKRRSKGKSKGKEKPSDAQMERWLLSTKVMPALAVIVLTFAVVTQIFADQRREQEKQESQSAAQWTGIPHSGESESFWHTESLLNPSLMANESSMASHTSRVTKGSGNHLRIWQVRDFLDPRTAASMSDFLIRSFAENRTAEDPLSERHRQWVFVCNDGGSNKKIRSNEMIPSRLVAARRLFREGRFSYVKYELRKRTFFYRRVRELLNSTEVLSLVSLAVGETVEFLSDLFITAFDKGHFLSNHDDFGLGKYAFVLGLSPKEHWNAQMGGATRFLCFDRRKRRDLSPFDYCFEQPPSLNTLVLFQVHPQMLTHAVQALSEHATLPRLAVTGWFVPSNGAGFRRSQGYFEQLGTDDD